MSQIVGMAIPVTPQNNHKIAVVSGGCVPYGDGESIPNDVYFVFPYDAELHCQLIPGEVFRANYRFANPRSTDHFVDIIEI